MSNFPRKTVRTVRPELAVLLAQVAARQALTPTARSVAVTTEAVATPASAPEISPFLAPTLLSRARAERRTSFNTEVAAALLTGAKGS